MITKQNFIPLSVPHVRGNEWKYVKDCLDTEWLSYVGSYVTRFEKELAEFVDAKHAIGTVSGTSALHTALIVSGVGVNDEVVMPALTFVAPGNAVRYCGAYPAFVDVDASTWQWDLDKVEDFLDNHCEREKDGSLCNKHTGRRVVALLPVHLLGSLIDRNRLFEISEKYALPLIEDNAESLGAEYDGKGIGHSFKETGVAHFSCTSFNGNKIMTTGGGGAVFTNNEVLAERISHLSTTAKIDPIEFDHDELGYNYRMTNVAAAIGCGQLENLKRYVSQKRKIAQIYKSGLAEIADKIEHLPELNNSLSTYWLYTVNLKQDSRSLLKYLGEKQIQTRPLWKLLSKLPYLSESYIHSDKVSESLVENCLSLPCSIGLTAEDQDRVCREVINYYH